MQHWMSREEEEEKRERERDIEREREIRNEDFAKSYFLVDLIASNDQVANLFL